MATEEASDGARRQSIMPIWRKMLAWLAILAVSIADRGPGATADAPSAAEDAASATLAEWDGPTGAAAAHASANAAADEADAHTFNRSVGEYGIEIASATDRLKDERLAREIRDRRHERVRPNAPHGSRRGRRHVGRDGAAPR